MHANNIQANEISSTVGWLYLLAPLQCVQNLHQLRSLALYFADIRNLGTSRKYRASALWGFSLSRPVGLAVDHIQQANAQFLEWNANWTHLLIV